MIRDMPLVSFKNGRSFIGIRSSLPYVDISQGSWTWFEVVILPNSESEEPKRTKDGREMAWRSHANQTAHGDKTLHYGLMFDRRSELLASLEVDNVLAVRACVRFPGWVNNGERAFITTRMLNDGECSCPASH
jgi:hypothetical protein